MITGKKIEPKILGILYLDEEGSLSVVNETGSHQVVLDQVDGGNDMPVATSSLISLNMVHVDWLNGEREYWGEEMWQDLLSDMETEGQDTAQLVETNKNNVFKALLIG